MIYKLIKFGITGCIGLCVDFSITFLLKEKLKVNKYIANGCGFTAAVINNFFINRFWTFNSTNHLWQTELLKFSLIAIIGLGLSTLLIYLFNERLGIQFYISKALSILIVFCWNFTLNFLFNFH